MTRQMAMRIKKLEAIYREVEADGKAEGNGVSRRSDQSGIRGALAAVGGHVHEKRRATAAPLSIGRPFTGPSQAFMARAQSVETADCLSAVAIDFSAVEWTEDAWLQCLNLLVSRLAPLHEASAVVEMLEGYRFVVLMPGAWEGEAIKAVRELRQTLWRYAPAFGVCSVVPGLSIREVVEVALERADRAAQGSVTVRFGGTNRRIKSRVSVAA